MPMMASGLILGGGSYSYSVYHNDEVYALSTNSSGMVEWQSEVMKAQESPDEYDPNHSYRMLQYPMGNILLYIDVKAGDKRFITAYVSNTGEMIQKQFASSVYSRMEDDVILIQNAKQVSATEILFPVLKRGSLSFVKIEF